MQVKATTGDQGTADELATNLWIAERKKRITASTCGQVAKRRSTTKVASQVKTFLYTSFKGNAATKWGSLQEPETQSAYLTRKQSTSSAIAVNNSEFVIHPSHHWLGASPDGLVSDPTSADREGIVEYKNPYATRSMTLQNAATHR